MFKKKSYMIILSILLVFSLLTPAMANGNENEAEHDPELWKAVKPLDTIASFLNTGAHPDDERSHLLAYLSLGLGVNTASIIANRGEGGQNEIGGELGNGLGIIRSREMIEASKITGVKVWHLSEFTSDEIYDFGFSKSPDETLEKWGEDVTYERFIRRIREYKPDIVMPSFQNVETQHGHHRAITILTLQAFEDAADPTVFPEHSKDGLQPWQIKKLYLPAGKESATLAVEVGDYDPVYEMTYPQLGEKSRYLHKSQGMGNDIKPGSRLEYFKLEKSAVSDVNKKEESLFDGLHYDFNDYAANITKGDNRIKGMLQKLQNDLEEVTEAYPSHKDVLVETHDALKQLRQTIQNVEKFSLDAVDKNDLLHRLTVKEQQLQHTSEIASQLKVKTTLDSSVLNQGQTVNVTVELENKGKKALSGVNIGLNVPENWKVEGKSNDSTLAAGKKLTHSFKVTVPNDAQYYEPYDAGVLSANVSYVIAQERVSLQFLPDETTAVLPEVGLKALPETLVVNTARERKAATVNVIVTNYSASNLETEVALQLPNGWNTVNSQKVTFAANEKEKQVSFTVTPPETITDEQFDVKPIAKINGKELTTNVQEISYDHIGTFYYLSPAVVKGVAFDLKFPEDLKVGYIDSGFDKVADQLAEVGMDITKIEDVGTEDLSKYDTVVTGIRAYLSRDDLVNNNQKLLEYAENGGHVVVQYHKPGDGWNAETTAPFPLTIGSPSIKWRVTDETSPYTILQPNHALFNAPNRIDESDWDGWVQERGLYYPMKWDARYETLIEMTDLDGATFDGGILLAEHGEGSYLYTNLVWYRQIQGQVPGGYRIFTNLVSYKKSN